MPYKQTCVYGVPAGRRLRGIELYRRQKTTSCTIEPESNFSLAPKFPRGGGSLFIDGNRSHCIPSVDLPSVAKTRRKDYLE